VETSEGPESGCEHDEAAHQAAVSPLLSTREQRKFRFEPNELRATFKQRKKNVRGTTTTTTTTLVIDTVGRQLMVTILAPVGSRCLDDIASNGRTGAI
jgi:hypothetical protein